MAPHPARRTLGTGPAPEDIDEAEQLGTEPAAPGAGAAPVPVDLSVPLDAADPEGSARVRRVLGAGPAC